MFVITGLSDSIYFRPWPHLTITGTKNIVLDTKDFVQFRGSLYQVSRQTRREIPPWFSALYENPLRM